VQNHRYFKPAFDSSPQVFQPSQCAATIAVAQLLFACDKEIEIELNLGTFLGRKLKKYLQ
jgi:hypothetical protein